VAKSNLTSAGALFRDGHNQAVQVGSTFVTRDATTGTPQASPLAYTTSETAIVIPDESLELRLFPTTDLRVSEVTGMARYTVVPGGTEVVFPVARMSTVYVKGDTVAGSVRFLLVNI
jgi:hypothetical protein